ncbi:ferredoxin [Nocardioides sp. Arc9.136]|uniref:(2Fe-2S) ferredoxin domain-containing protein n=1 Tax=Nocardioides sp. Arc9.136 TaxID=2996826 RepID=UPI002666DEBC|nr:(2Fe-2S) ferredoxin domain-containing protein [Nocardioides sp. Arc9.136]WKN48958.1 (2Fe-2S) ferredoxin domain-containing protein [Nocardioides sp. Arc9.136]
MTAFVLVGTSPGDPARRGELLGLARRVGAELAFLQLGSPGLGTTLTRLADDGATRVVVVGVGGATGPGVSWLRRVAAHWWATYGAGAPELLTAPAYLTDETGWDDLVSRARPVTDGGAGLRSGAWEDVPRHRHQVLVCRGPRCTAAGAEESAGALVLALAEHGLGDDDVLLTQTGCQFPCNRAPVVTVHPDDVWYGTVDPAGAAALVAEHLVGGTPVERLRLRRVTSRDDRP